MKGIVRRMFRPLSHSLARMRCRRGFGVHSPFAFRFISDVINEQRRYNYEAYGAINRIARSTGTPAFMLRRYYRLLVMADTTVVHPGSNEAFQEVTRLYRPSKRAMGRTKISSDHTTEVWVVSSPDDPLTSIAERCSVRGRTFVMWPDTRTADITRRFEEAMSQRSSGPVFLVGHSAIMVLTSALAAKDYRL